MPLGKNESVALALDEVHTLTFRAPVATGSVVDLVCRVARETTVEEINAAAKEAAEGDPQPEEQPALAQA